MKIDEYMNITAKLAEIAGTLEDLETNLIAKFGDRCNSAVWARLTNCVLVLTVLNFQREYESRFGNEQGGWNLTE